MRWARVRELAFSLAGQAVGLFGLFVAILLIFTWGDAEWSLRLTVGSGTLGLSSVVFHWGYTGRLFPRLLPLDQVLAMANLGPDIQKALAPITQFYEWSQDRWSSLAKGSGGAAVSLLLAVVGFGLGEGALTATVEAATNDQTTLTISQAVAQALPEVFSLTALLFVVAALGWVRSAVAHRDYAQDLAAVSDTVSL